MPEFESQIAKTLERTQTEIKELLCNSWERLYWEEEITFQDGTKKKGIQLEKSGDGSFSYLTPYGQFFVITREQKILPIPPENDFYLKLACRAEKLLFETRQRQLEEIKNTPEGKDVLWGSRKELCGYMNFGRGSVTVRMKKDGLYCSKHPQEHLLSVPTHDGQGGRALICPTGDCAFGGVDLGI